MKKKHYICLLILAGLVLLTRLIAVRPLYSDVFPPYLYRTDIFVCGHLVQIIGSNNEIYVNLYRVLYTFSSILLALYLIRIALLVWNQHKTEIERKEP